MNECLSEYVQLCEEKIFGSNENQNSLVSIDDKDKKSPGRNPLIGGLSADTFLSLSHALRCYADFIEYLLAKKHFKHVLPGFSNNDRIEKYFCFMRCLASMHLALDIASFCQNARTELF